MAVPCSADDKKLAAVRLLLHLPFGGEVATLPASYQIYVEQLTLCCISKASGATNCLYFSICLVELQASPGQAMEERPRIPARPDQPDNVSDFEVAACLQMVNEEEERFFLILSWLDMNAIYYDMILISI